MKNLYIWWTDQRQCELAADVVSADKDCVPNYVRDELDSRYGRAGRGRLWLSSALKADGFAVDPWPDSALAKELGSNSNGGSGGIVFHMDDFEHVKKLPGVITNHLLEEISRS